MALLAAQLAFYPFLSSGSVTRTLYSTAVCHWHPLELCPYVLNLTFGTNVFDSLLFVVVWTLIPQNRLTT